MKNVRIDKYLFAVRIFKTRSIASEECRLGKIYVNGMCAKASKEVNIDDEIIIKLHGYNRIIKVLDVLEKRIGASLVSNYYVDITPEEEILKKEMINLNRNEYRNRGLGRPTKKERREIEKFKDK
jgi:ribosome-associated heat shock protein Hsp15